MIGMDAMTPSTTATGEAKDPVCRMTVDPATTPHRHTHGGDTYFFCSGGCRAKFAANPKRYLSRLPAVAAAPAGTIYTCPMHPQVRQEGPGSCPICGMALEPELVSAEPQANPELAGMTRRLWVAALPTPPGVSLEMGGHLFDLHRLIAPPAF